MTDQTSEYEYEDDAGNLRRHTADQTSADQAAANAHAVTDRLLIHGDNKIEAAALILALRQENAELRRALEDERAARRASVNVAVKTKLGSGRKP